MSLITVNVDTRSIVNELKPIKHSLASIAESMTFIVEALKSPGNDESTQQEIDIIASRLRDANDALEAVVDLYDGV